MSDLYSELLVKKEPTVKDAVTKYGLIGATAIFVFGGLFIHPLLLIGAVAFGVACYFIVPKTSLEFDYKDHKRFAIITRLNGENCKVIIEPDEALAHAMKNSAPSKVFLD